MCKKKLFLLVTAAFCLASCHHDLPQLTLSSASNLEIPLTGGSADITFCANRDWTAEAGSTWLHVSPSSGSGSSKPITVTVTCDPNSTYDNRNSAVTITCDWLTQSVMFSQPSNQGLVVPKTEYTLGAGATTLEVEIQTNVAYSVIVGANWIKKTGTKGLPSTVVVFSVEANTTSAERSTTIKFTGEGLSQVVTVKQAAGS